MKRPTQRCYRPLMRTLLVLGALVAAASASAAPRFWGSLTPGPHAVGFRTMAGESAPGAAGSEARPVEIAVWYPAAASDAPPLRFGAYFELASDLRRRSAPEGISADDLPRTLSVTISGDADAVPREQAQAILDADMLARRDVAPSPGPFPVVMWSARYGTVAAQAVLSEFLASRGYVVATVRPVGSQEKLPFEVEGIDAKLAELDAQTDDVRGALRAVRALPFADDLRTAMLAWSYAGESAWRIAQSDARIDLVVGLDTNVRSSWVYQSGDAVDAAPFAPRFVSLDKSTPALAGMAHGNFNTIEGMIPGVLGIERVQRWSKSGAIARTGYERVVQSVGAELARTFAAKRTDAFRPIELRAADDHAVTADLYRPEKKGTRCAALFHQSGSSRGEYRTIAPELTRLGLTVLSVDVRWGNADRWNDVVNETAARHGTPAAWEKRDRARIDAIRAGARHDLDAAVDWLRADGCTSVVVWGASIHANGVLELAARRPRDVAAVVDVSPGEYAKEEPDRMKGIAAKVTAPTLVLWARDEDEVSRQVHDALPESQRRSYASSGRHGNALVFEDPATWIAIRDFLATVSEAPL
jgi:dienelactone hydrolase